MVHTDGKPTIASGRYFEVILSNGDRAEADDLDGALLAARTLRNEAVDHGCSPRLGRETIVTRDGEYDPVATNLAREGHSRALSTEWSR